MQDTTGRFYTRSLLQKPVTMHNPRILFTKGIAETLVHIYQAKQAIVGDRSLMACLTGNSGSQA